jgi:hypothetical protein
MDPTWFMGLPHGVVARFLAPGIRMDVPPPVIGGF